MATATRSRPCLLNRAWIQTKAEGFGGEKGQNGSGAYKHDRGPQELHYLKRSNRRFQGQKRRYRRHAAAGVARTRRSIKRSTWPARWFTPTVSLSQISISTIEGSQAREVAHTVDVKFTSSTLLSGCHERDRNSAALLCYISSQSMFTIV